MPKIKVNIAALPTEIEAYDEGIAYRGVLRAIELSDEPDKNGNHFFKGVDIEILEPEQFRGRHVFDNYVCIPSGSTKADLENGVRLKCMVESFKMPYDEEGVDPTEALGHEGDFQVYNDEYQGRKTGKVATYLI